MVSATTKLPDDKLLDVLEFGIPIKWKWKIQDQNFKPIAGILRDFQDFCEHLESALDDPPADNKSNKTSGQEKGNKKTPSEKTTTTRTKSISACCTGITLRTAPNSVAP